MARSYTNRRPASAPAEADVAAELERIAALNIDALREHWRKAIGAEPPKTLTKDLLARALAHRVQEERFGGLAPHLHKLLATIAKNGLAPVRHLKVGSLIVREHGDVVHEVMVVPGGFLWRGQTYSSLSTIALKITGTSWNGPRFFGLRGEIDIAPVGNSVVFAQSASARASRSPSVTKLVKRGARGT